MHLRAAERPTRCSELGRAGWHEVTGWLCTRKVFLTASAFADHGSRTIASLTNELLDIPLAQADCRVVRARLVEAREHVVVSARDALRIDIHQAAVHLEQCDHFGAALGHHQCVRLARRLEDVAALLGDPVVLEIKPAALEHPRVYGARVPMARDHARPGDAHYVRVLAQRYVEL